MANNVAKRVVKRETTEAIYSMLKQVKSDHELAEKNPIIQSLRRKFLGVVE